MEDQHQPEEPITYVGGLGEEPRRSRWPYAALGAVPILLAVLLIALWGPIRNLGQAAGRTVAPYSLALTDAAWSSDDLIAKVPVTLTIGVTNTDQRNLHGLTLRFTKLDRSWQILGASSPNAHGVVNDTTVFFPNEVRPNGNIKLSIVMRPTMATQADIGVTLASGHEVSNASVDLGNGQTVSTVLLLAKVRLPTDDDAYAQITALYDPLPSKEQQSSWEIHVANTGPIAIDQIQLVFPSAMHGPFQLLWIPAQGTLLPDGNTLQFNLSLPPGGQTTLFAGIVPHVAGHFQIPVQVYLQKSMVPLIAPDGGAPLSIDLTVS